MNRIPDLYVEGRDDLYAIQSLLEVNGIRLVENQGPVRIKPTYSVSEMMGGLDTYVKAAQAARSPVGFVMDIDFNLENRWKSICTRLSKLGFVVPDGVPDANGAVFELPAGKVGIWLMPDNQSHVGKLEDFLRTFIRDDDAAWPKAKGFVKDVSSSIKPDARFRDVDVEKAELSAWLSVKDPPGQPYGTAIKAHILEPISPIAAKFVTWFKKVYAL